MIALLTGSSELRRFGHGVLPKLAILALTLLPLIFGGLFVWAYFDPIGHLDRLPVALVNSDKGADAPGDEGGERVEAGAEVAEQVVEAGVLDIHEVDAAEAKDGVADGTYYLAIEIPEDFSEAATSAAGDNPRSATINVALSNANGFIPTLLGNQATQALISAVDEKLGEEVTDRLLLGYTLVGEGLDKAAEGAGAVDEGAGTAKSGAEALDGGIGELNERVGDAAEGARTLDGGARALDEGIGAAAGGAAELAEGLRTLQAATDALAAGSGAVADGVDEAADTVGDVTAKVAEARGRAAAVLGDVAEALRDVPLADAQALADKAEELKTRIEAGGEEEDIASKVALLQAGAREVAGQLAPGGEYRAGVDAAAQAAALLETGLGTLKDGSQALVVGTGALVSGSQLLADGVGQLTVGAGALREGLVALDDGAGELHLQLSDAAGDAPRFDEADRAQRAPAAANPASGNLTDEEPSLFGVGLAPFFFSLAMFMGATIIFLVVRPRIRRTIDSGTPPWRAVVASYLPAALIGQAQAIAVYLVATLAIGLEPEHPLGLLGALMGLSAVFVAVTQALNTIAGPAPGRVACLALMGVQLVSSGGLYPVETQPRLLQWIHVVDPMTYGVNVLRHAIVGGQPGDPRLQQGIVVLACVLAGAWLLSAVCTRAARRLKVSQLHPQLEV
ncbi:YhgE/Pip family protein [Corynebacterium otitidis]